MKRTDALALLVAVCVIATCGLVYELVAGTLASYLLGDTVTQFSTIIGAYLFAMGVGSYFSKFINHNLLAKFITIEYLVGVIGGLSATFLFLLFNYAAGFKLLLYGFVFLTGILVGLEIPLLMRILKDSLDFKNLVSRVFTFDYLGALLASLVFPLLFVPRLGLIRTALFFGILNVITGLLICFLFQQRLVQQKLLKLTGFLSLIILMIFFVYAERIQAYGEQLSFPGKIIHARSTPYQRMVLTRTGSDIRLFLNNNLQFSSADEYRYHEALVHPAMQSSASLKNILILGGGDGLALREVLKYPETEKITLVDLDPAMTNLFSTHPLLTRLNQSSLNNKKVEVVNTDAFIWLQKTTQQFDVVIIDFPDPSNYSLGKLYSLSFYNHLNEKLRPGGWAVVQSTSPFVAKRSYWCVDTTLRTAGFNTIPYYNNVPSFGMWGYILAGKNDTYQVNRNLPAGLQFFDNQQFESMRLFPADMIPKKKPDVNRLNNQVLVGYFEEEWNKYQHG
jgi:spermidine synthase